MIKCDNVSKKQIKRETVFVIWVDIRGSSILNTRYNPSVLHEMYSEALNTVDEILRDNGFDNIDIQGDGIYGVSNLGAESVCNAIYQINDKAINYIGDPEDNDLVTISVNYGNEQFGCFGRNGDEIGFFGNIVSSAKKWIANSLWSESKKTRIILSKEALLKLEQKRNKIRQDLNVSLKGGKKNKKFKGYY